MCDVTLDFSKRYAPVYRVPQRIAQRAWRQGACMADDERYLRQLCEEGLAWRYGTRDVPRKSASGWTTSCASSQQELLLLLPDRLGFLQLRPRSREFPSAPAAAAWARWSAICWACAMSIPLKYGLLFERFMDPSRNEMPDIDIDICQDGRQKVIEYVRNKYGHVAQIITFGTLAARAVCKDVGRVLGVPLAVTDKLTKLIPGTPGMTLDKALKQVPDLADLIRLRSAGQADHRHRQAPGGPVPQRGMHAAGVVIADQPLENFVPLYKDPATTCSRNSKARSSRKSAC
jgi:DNA polymerase III subunit alpha